MLKVDYPTTVKNSIYLLNNNRLKIVKIDKYDSEAVGSKDKFIMLDATFYDKNESDDRGGRLLIGEFEK